MASSLLSVASPVQGEQLRNTLVGQNPLGRQDRDQTLAVGQPQHGVDPRLARPAIEQAGRGTDRIAAGAQDDADLVDQQGQAMTADPDHDDPLVAPHPRSARPSSARSETAGRTAPRNSNTPSRTASVCGRAAMAAGTVITSATVSSGRA
jgi:hypothetical protein